MSTITLAPPERTTHQRLTALHHANQIRTARATLKRDLKTGRTHIHQLLTDPPDTIATMHIYDLLTAVPYVGRVKANRILAQSRVSPSKTVSGLTERQRDELAGRLDMVPKVGP
jgi:hypothetical protein